MIGFAHPELLALLPIAGILPLIVVRRRRPALQYSDLRLLEGLPTGTRAIWATWGGASLRMLIATALILAAANPRTPDLQTRIIAEGVAVVLALDVSGSMATPDFASPGQPAVSRLEAAKRSFRLFVEGGDSTDGSHFPGRPDDPIGLVTFAAVPRTACPLTLNHTVLLNILDAQEPKTGVDAGTNLGDAMVEGLLRLEAAEPSMSDGRPLVRVLIVLSDGEHNVATPPGGPLSPRQAAEIAASLGIPLHTIDCGGPVQGATAEQRLAGRQLLTALAERTGGRSFTADNAAELEAVYQEIDQLTRVKFLSPLYRRYHDYSFWCGLIALVLLVLLVVLEHTVWRRIPD